jgi:hypothetical protein
MVDRVGEEAIARCRPASGAFDRFQWLGRR